MHDNAFSSSCPATIAAVKIVKSVLLLLYWRCECSESRENGSPSGMRLERGLVSAAF